MDSHSRSASPREPTRPQHRPPSPPSSPAAFDNRAYQHDESDPNHNDSFTSNGPQQNGHTKEPNGVPDAKTLEAVNLELINLTPKNGNAKQKKDVEVDMNAANPYDEYFVPVNEHRKYMRGEKLYVTADKRGEKAGCKRPLCWTMLALVVAAIVAIVVLAATGILFSNSPTPLEQYNTSVSSARALGGISHVHSGGDQHDHSQHDHSQHDQSLHDLSQQENSQEPEQEHSTEPSEQHGPEAQNDEGHQHSIVSEEAGDATMYVPRTVEGELKVDNEEFVSALEDPESSEYREFVNTFTDGLKRALFDRNELDSGDNEVTVEVVQLRKGSVIVKYRIHWKPKTNVAPEEDLLNTNTLETNLNEYLAQNNRMISTYHIAEDKMAARQVLDICQINKNGCEHGCEFDETTLEFTCTCPHGQMLDMGDPKKCVSIFENNEKVNQDQQKEFRFLDVDSNPSTIRNIPEEEKPATESVHINENTFDWKETHHMMPETTTETDSDVNFSHIFGNPTERPHETLSEDNPAPEPTAEPKAEPEPTAEPQAEPEPIVEPKAEPEHTAEPKAELEPTAEPKTEPEPTAEPKAEPEPTAEPKAEPEPSAEPKAEPEPSAEPKAEPEPTAEPKAEPEANAEPNPTVAPTSEPEPTSEPKLEPEARHESDEEIEPKSEPEPIQETGSEPEAEPETKPEPEAEPEPQSEPKSETKPITEPEPEPEPTSEPDAKPDIESITKHELETSSEQDYSIMMSTASNETNEMEIPTHTMESHAIAEREPISESEKPETTTMKEHFFPNIHSIIEPEMIITTEREEPESKAVTEEPKPTSLVESNHDSDLLTDHLSTSEEKVLYTNEGKFEYKPSEDTPVETTTLRISISEPNIINEPSYEPKPEIISILSDKKPSDETLASTTEGSDWLEDTLSGVKVNKNETDNITYEDILQYVRNKDSNNSIEHESEQRSFKIFDGDFILETTTAGKHPDKEVLFEQTTKDNEPVTDSSLKMHEETTIPSVTMLPTASSEKSGENGSDESTESTTLPNKLSATDFENSDLIKQNDSDIETVIKSENGTKDNASMITSLIEEAKSLDTNKKDKNEEGITTPEIELPTENYSINKHFKEPVGDQLINILENKNHTVATEKPTENDVSTDGMDITFDAINMLYNRSSKSIEKQSNNTNNATHEISENNELLNENTANTTESDWLFEPVTEVNYNEAMNKMEPQEIAHTTTMKIEDIMPHGLSKEDFEPDYLNNMGSGNNKQDQDVASYGMVHDYDNEDNRFKRVNEDKDNTTDSLKAVSNEVLDDSKIIPTTPAAPGILPIETTTVSEYIYKMSEKSNEEPVVMLEIHNETDSDSSTNAPAVKSDSNNFDAVVTIENTMSTMIPSIITSPENELNIKLLPVTTAPAPVWEESEAEKDLTVKELSNIASETNQHIPIDEAQYPTTTSSTTTTLTTINEIEDKTNDTQNETQLNNLNVTIYEISSQNGNNSFSVAKQSSNSAEYEDHETEMNPFLPEVENNKSLVKILQEGHDIEPTILNETQNENMEEHASNPSEMNATTNNEGNKTSSNLSSEANYKETITSNTDDETSFNELLHTVKENYNSYENDTENITTNTTVKPQIESNKVTKAEEKENIPSFLTDTDDLITTKDQSTPITVNKIESEVSSPTTSAPTINNDNEYLSVVPITEEKEELEKQKSENLEELNDISDTPNTSDERTLDTTKFDSVNNNEA